MSQKRISNVPMAWQGLIDVLAAMLNGCYTAGGLAEGTNAHTVKTANTVVFTINGLFYSKAAVDNVAIPAGTVIAVNKFCKFLVSLKSDGTPVVTQGTQAATSALALVPDCPDSQAPIGYFEVATDGTHTYTPGTTDNSAAGITVTYADIARMPNGI